MSTILEAISTLEGYGVPTPGIRAALLKQGYSSEEVAEALPKAKKRGFAAEYYDWLVEEARTEEEVAEYILDPKWGGKEDKDGKTNIQRHLSHYSAIAEMTRRIHEA